MNPQSEHRLCAVLCVLFVALGLPGISQADVDLLGRTEATFRWQPPSSGVVLRYDIYEACGISQAPDDFPPTRSFFIEPDLIAPEPPSWIVARPYGYQCKIRVVAWDQYGRMSPVSLSSELVKFIEPPPADNDFDGDGLSDIIVQDPDDGSAVLLPGSDLHTGDDFLLQRTTISTAGNVEWQPLHTGDFDGDGSPDFLWSSPVIDADTGVTTITLYAGSKTYNAKIVLTDLSEGEVILAVGDFDGDGVDDILHRTDDIYGTVWVTFMGPAGTPNTRRYPGVQSQFDFVASGDFDGDGNDDIMWRRGDTGQTVIWLMADAIGRMTLANSGILAGDDWVGEGAGNFNNFAEDDVIWRNHATGETLVWYMDDLERPYSVFPDVLMPSNWQLLAIGDLNKDGRADITWIDKDTNLLEVWRMDEKQDGGFTDQ